jgi:hypothetical protein
MFAKIFFMAELFSEGKALHRVFYQYNKVPAIRLAKSEYKRGILSPNRIKSILEHYGFTKCKEADYELTKEPVGDWTGNCKRKK